MSAPLVSICVPNLNKRPFLPERMESLLSQTVSDWEMIVCDNYSDDGSWEYLQQFKSDPRIRLEQVPREGMYACWNQCLRRAHGKYFHMATSDDTCRPEMLEGLLEPLERHPDLDIAVCDFSIVDEQGAPVARNPDGLDLFDQEARTRRWIRSREAEFLMHLCFGTAWMVMNSLLFRHRVFERAGDFPTTQGSHGDIEWSLRASLTSDVAVVPEPLVAWRRYSWQATPKKMPPDAERIVLSGQEKVLRDPASGIPEAWRAMPDFEEKLLAAPRARYAASFELYRWAARARPREFFGNLCRAWRMEPALLWRQASRGFRYGKELDVDPVAIARELMRELKVEWPPKRRWDEPPLSAQNSDSN